MLRLGIEGEELLESFISYSVHNGDTSIEEFLNRAADLGATALVRQ
jgi:hypothetical protein